MSLPRAAGSTVVLLLMLFASGIVSAHPEDEFCVPGEDGLDPELCAALAALDRQGGASVNAPLTDAAGVPRSAASTVALYVSIGVRHILPGGLDHILFVLALFLAARRARDLVLQVSAFTVAHTMTLALAAAGAVSPPASVVEPLIAATIAFVAAENLWFKELTRWRPAVVFLFGLVHGLGFAGFFGELGLPPGQFWSALIGFNVGVEAGQLAVIAAALMIAAPARRRIPAICSDRGFRRYVAIPLSALIALTGAIWTVQRIVAAG